MRFSQTTNISFSSEKNSTLFNKTEKYINYYAPKLDVIRFFAICSIVWGHTILEWEIFKEKEYFIIQSILLQLGKIGTTNFFIISGFLLNKRINGFNIFSYLNYRKYSLILPWFVFLSLLVLIHTGRAYNQALIFNGTIIKSIKEIIGFYRDFIVYNAYWFVPVSIISSCILIIFKKNLNKFWFILLILTSYFFYSFNLYHAWVSQTHTKAIFAYVIFMWIGIQTSRNIIYFRMIIEKIQWSALIFCMLLLFSMACFEGIYLSSLGSKDPYSSLRVSNSALSVLIFIIFLKLPYIKWVKILKPAYYVFGVYLIQAITINELIPLFSTHLVKINESNIVQVIIIQGLTFLTIFISTYLLSIFIKNSKIRFIIGRK